MALIRREATEVVKSEEDKIDWGNLENGDHEGRLVFIADLGLQAKDYKKEFKGNYQQISLGIEVIGESKTTEDGDVLPRILTTKPFSIYTTMGGKSKEFEYYSMFEPRAVADSVPDWEAQLGKAISVCVENVQGKGENKDKTYDNIKSLSKIPEKYQDGVGEAISPLGIGDSEDEECPVTKALFGLPRFVWEKRIIPGGEGAESGESESEGGSQEGTPGGVPEDDSDEIPY